MNRRELLKRAYGFALGSCGLTAAAAIFAPRKELFTFSPEYSPTPRLGQQVFQYQGDIRPDREGQEDISRVFNEWAQAEYDGNCEPIRPNQVMASEEGEVFVRANCNERRVLEEKPELEPGPLYCDLEAIRDFEGQDVYEPFSPEARELFRQAAECADVPQEWAESDSLHRILRAESGGRVGIPNYTILLASTGAPAKNSPESWPRIHELLREGYDALEEALFEEGSFIRTNHSRMSYSSASGLGQLLIRRADEFYPLGRAGIGNALAEATGMLAYIKNAHGTPERAWTNYNRFGEGY